MTYARKRRILVAGVFVIASVGCQEQQSPEPVVSQPDPFEEAMMLGEVYPMANGTAYLASFRGLFHVAGATAEPVTGLPIEGFGELTALADGSALYVLSFGDPPKMFWIRGSTAIPVVEGEGTTDTSRAAMPEGFFFAEIQRLRRRVEELSSEVAAFDEPEEPYYGPEPY